VCALRHERPSGRFSKSRRLSASVSFHPSPPPPPSFTRSIFRAVILCSRTPQKRLPRRLRLRGLYEQRAREKDPFSIFCESSLNTGAELKDETCTWLDLIYRRLSARRRIKRPWYLEFTCHIPKESFLALKRTFSITTKHDLRGKVSMEGNRKGFSNSIAYFPSVLYMFRILIGKRIEQCCIITDSVTHISFLCMTKFALYTLL